MGRGPSEDVLRSPPQGSREECGLGERVTQDKHLEHSGCEEDRQSGPRSGGRRASARSRGWSGRRGRRDKGTVRDVGCS